MKLFSPGKVNLFFRVLNKCENRFHQIATLMQAISIGDILHFRISCRDVLTCTHPLIPVDATNLIDKARLLFRKKTGFKYFIAIHIEKKIPIEGGFGGGSGNIATTLWALNQMSQMNIDEKILQSWSSEISSDAPFFFSTGTAYVTGCGETVCSFPLMEKKNFYLAKPQEGLSTSLVYHHCQPNINPIDPKRLLHNAIDGKLDGINDLEYPAFFLYPSLQKLKRKLIDMGFDTVVMTGSGTGFYCEGTVNNPSLAGVQFWKGYSMTRKDKDKWYPFPESLS